MGKRYKVAGRCTVYIDTWFVDDGKTNLDDLAMEALQDAAHISSWGGEDEIDTDDWEVEEIYT